MSEPNLAQQIRDRLDGLAPQPLTFEFPADWTAEQREQFNAEFKATPAAMPPAFIEPAEPLSPEEIERWQEQWDELLPVGARVHTIRILPPGPRAYPGFEQMRDAILGALDVHTPQPAGVPTKPHLRDCAACLDVGPEWCDHVGYPCDTVLAIATGLGIEADHA